MRRLLPNNTNHVAVWAQNAQSLPDDDLFIPPTQRREPEHPFRVDMGDDEADLVDMPGQDDSRNVLRACPGTDSSVRISDNIMRHFVGKRASFLSPDASRPCFVPRRS